MSTNLFMGLWYTCSTTFLCCRMISYKCLCMFSCAFSQNLMYQMWLYIYTNWWLYFNIRCMQWLTTDHKHDHLAFFSLYGRVSPLVSSVLVIVLWVRIFVAHFVRVKSPLLVELAPFCIYNPNCCQYITSMRVAPSCVTWSSSLFARFLLCEFQILQVAFLFKCSSLGDTDSSQSPIPLYWGLRSFVWEVTELFSCFFQVA